ncbi:Cupin domain protein [Roseivivax sp. THAF40]|uniref:cupin domain-containing protein n=1 Tax=unclassified Roseivivax TaxID=2639302 RepID=UPI0012693CA5|nr:MULTISPECIES: cupin domain-containing protein [unclassified Roseivivax]QFS82610.1 Cupin domain protein [Roseivivax sp. THAF197b]QFT46378.1 Cupin domain protein [Roseivivax sp. THAF40]
MKILSTHSQSPTRYLRRVVIGSTILALSATMLFAEGHFPTEHAGLQVEQLANVPPDSIERQLGLEGRMLLARRITIMPGGQIAKHSHDTVPGIVFMESGAWTEGTDEGETLRSAGDTFIEDADTTHWFYNRGDAPASALVFDIKPSS